MLDRGHARTGGSCLPLSGSKPELRIWGQEGPPLRTPPTLICGEKSMKILKVHVEQACRYQQELGEQHHMHLVHSLHRQVERDVRPGLVRSPSLIGDTPGAVHLNIRTVAVVERRAAQPLVLMMKSVHESALRNFRMALRSLSVLQRTRDKRERGRRNCSSVHPPAREGRNRVLEGCSPISRFRKFENLAMVRPLVKKSATL